MILIVHCVMPPVGAYLFTSSSPELRVPESQSGSQTPNGRLFTSLRNRFSQGLPALLPKALLFPFMPLETPGKGQLVEENLCCFTRLSQTITINFRLEAKRMSILIKHLFLLPIHLEIILVKNLNVFLYLSLCTSIPPRSCTTEVLDQIKANRLMGDFFVPNSPLECSFFLICIEMHLKEF